MTYRLATLAIVLSAACSRSIDADQVKLVALARDAFSISVPDWPVEVSTGTAPLGKHKVARGLDAFTEVSWQGGEALSAAELKQLADAVTGGFQFKRASESATSLADQDRYTVIASIGDESKAVWLWMTLIQCHKTNVTVTVGVGTRAEKSSRVLGDRILATFRCLGDSPVAFAPATSPTSTLPPEFGYAEQGGSWVLANPDGRAVMAIMSAGDLSVSLEDNADKLLGTIGQLMGMKLAPAGKPVNASRGDGAARWQVHATLDGKPAAVASLHCPAAGLTFVLLAFDDKDATTAADLATLTAQFDCPVAERPLSTGRKTACELGVTAFCPDAGAAAPP